MGSCVFQLSATVQRVWLLWRFTVGQVQDVCSVGVAVQDGRCSLPDPQRMSVYQARCPF